MGKLLTGMISIIGALWLGIAGARLWIHWRLPAGPIAIVTAQRDEALAAYQTERASFLTMHDAFTVENAAVLSLKAQGDAWQAKGRRLEVQVTKDTAWRLTLAKSIMATPDPAGEDQADRCVAAEGVLREGGQ